MRGNSAIWVASAVGAAVVGGLLYFAFSPVKVERFDTVDAGSTKTGRGIAVSEGSGAKRASSPSVGDIQKQSTGDKKRTSAMMAAAPDWYTKLPSAEERALGGRIQAALDGDDRAAVIAAAEDALTCKSAEVRQAAVESLTLQGAEAIPVLKKYLSDSNSGVADSAYMAWDNAVDGIDHELGRANAVKEALPLIKGAEHLDSALGKIAAQNRPKAIRDLAELAESGDAGISSAAKRAYEELTGERFESRAAAVLKARAIDME